MPKKLTAKFLGKKKVPKVLIAGLLMASVLGWTGWKNLRKVKNYYQIKQIFPQTTVKNSIRLFFKSPNHLTFFLLKI